jgi:bifunctional N-acetylglucosamine-1-phosphate-uridyltransferase/glucosamine-1-phosphate-acetyltransferase GlmU-like protein
MERVLVVPAAGIGSRLQTDLPKALTPVAGRAMIDHLVELFAPWTQHVIVVAHPRFAARVEDHLAHTWTERVSWRVVVQESPTGMLDAILKGLPVIAEHLPDRVWTVWCDQVGLRRETLMRVAHAEQTTDAALVFPTVVSTDPYIHFDRNERGQIVGVRQRREGDSMPAAGESDAGFFALSRRAYEDHLPVFAGAVSPGAGTGERNFLPFIPWLAARAEVATVPCEDPREAIGINTREELRTVEAWLATRAARS